MSIYLCHGFRWHRDPILAFIILQKVDDASPTWLMSPSSSTAILRALHKKHSFLPSSFSSPFPDLNRTSNPTNAAGENPASADDDNDAATFPKLGGGILDDDAQRNDWDESNHDAIHDGDDPLTIAQPFFSSPLRLLEQYDPYDLTTASSPYTYVTDVAIRVHLSLNVLDEIARYDKTVAALPQDQRPMAVRSNSSNSPADKGWLEKLRDELQADEEIGWYVVSCGDEERSWPKEDEAQDEHEDRLDEASRAILNSLIPPPETDADVEMVVDGDKTPPASASVRSHLQVH